MNTESRLCTADSEPMAFSALLGSVGEFVAKWDREHAKDPENTVKPGFCRHCGTSLGDTEDDKVIPIGKWGYLPNVCCEPCSVAGHKRLEDEERKRRELAFARIIPAEFLHWEEAKGNGQALAKALGKFSIGAKRSIVLHGTTGSCKTRIAWELLKRVMQSPDQITWEWLDAFEIAKKGFPDGATKCTYLVIDDLGNEPKGYKNEMRWETELLFILRRRLDWHRPVIITTQLTPTQFKERFFNGTAGDAVMRRFRQMTDSVATDKSAEL